MNFSIRGCGTIQDDYERCSECRGEGYFEWCQKCTVGMLLKSDS